jgi:uncharacterized protein YjdB
MASFPDGASPGSGMTTTITCLQCGGPLGPGDQYCSQCGAELLWCASCGEFLAEESCSKCGTPGIPRPASHTIPYELTEEDSPWAEVVARLRRATLGEFEIGHELGRGGMAAVFLAHELSLHRDVAIKVMSPGLLMGDGMIERFRREAITIAHLNHPNIVSVYSVRAVEGLHFFVMRCIQGRSLEQVIKDAGRLPVPIVRSILYQVGSALAYAHRFKVVHRDIKPANILIDEDGNAVVTDFGIAKAAEGPSHTHTGFMVGTPAYMSPEQCSGSEVSGASDQYSLGAVAYEMLTGVPPFTGSTYSVIQAHVERLPQPLTQHCEDCPPELEAAILRMLAKNPEERWPGMSQALTGLGAVALADDDPLRALLSRLATAGHAGMNGDSTHANVSGNSKTSTVLQVTPPGMMRAITILPPPPGLEVGDTFLLVARVHDGKVARLPVEPVEWSSDSPGVLRVNATKAVATAVSAGTALIKAICDGNEGRLRVTVAPPRADAIMVKPIERSISVGDEVRLEATPRDKRGRVVTRPVTWHSEDDAVATVSLAGVLVARSGGTTRVTAELDEARSSVAITVAPTPVAALHISPPPESVAAGDSFALTATPLDRWAGPLPGRTVAWNVSDVSVAVVTAGGWVITRNPGLVVLTATCESASASVSVNVVPRESAALPPRLPERSPRPARGKPEPWEIPPEPRQPAEPRRSRTRPGWFVAAGGAAMVAAGLWLVGGRPAPVATPASSESAAVARDTTATDSVASDDPPARPVSLAGAANGSAVPASVTITRYPPTALSPGSTADLVAEVRDSGGRILSDQPLKWSSTDTAVAVVDSTSGRLRAVRSGRTQVVASTSTSRDTARIVVRAGAGQPSGRERLQPASLTMAPHDPIRVGDTTSLSLTVQDAAGKPIRGARVAWSSSEPAVAEVDAAGKVRAHSPGSTLIIARSGSESAMGSLAVLPAAVASVRIDGAQPLKVGDTLALRAEARDQRGGGLGDRSIDWSSSNPDVAVVDSASGIVVARAAGSAEITATSEGKSGRARITILPQPRTGRVEPATEATVQHPVPSAPDPDGARQQILQQMMAGVEQCYMALREKDLPRVQALYNPATKTDLDKLKKLSRILGTHEWAAEIGEREDGAQRVADNFARMEFSFRMSWKDAFGGRLSSYPLFRAEFSLVGNQLTLSSCRITNSPKL